MKMKVLLFSSADSFLIRIVLHSYFDNDEGKKSEKEKLFEGASSDSQPKMRTAEEIKAKYRKTEVLVMMI